MSILEADYAFDNKQDCLGCDKGLPGKRKALLTIDNERQWKAVMLHIIRRG